MAEEPLDPTGELEAQFIRLTPANEDYLEAIVEVEESAGHPVAVRSVEVANLLNVSKASVNKALQALREGGYINQEHYGRIQLTDKGRSYGHSIWLRHQALRSFLINQLGVDEERADHEACAMEHTISQDTMDRWVEWLTGLDEAHGQA